MEEKYIKLGDLYVYRISLELCNLAWGVYESLDWKDRKIIGDQFITAIDSNAANIAEGYGRFHYLDRIKFYYNARASLLEAKHWTYLLHKRKKITKEKFSCLLEKENHVHYQLNKWIQLTFQKRDG